MNRDIICDLHDAACELNDAMNVELSKRVVANVEAMVDSTPADISARYWLIQLLEPLSRKDLKSIIDGFLVQMMNEEQCKKLVKFLLVRFPHYYTDVLNPKGAEEVKAPAPAPAAPAAPAPAPVTEEPAAAVRARGCR